MKSFSLINRGHDPVLGSRGCLANPSYTLIYACTKLSLPPWDLVRYAFFVNRTFPQFLECKDKSNA